MTPDASTVVSTSSIHSTTPLHHSDPLPSSSMASLLPPTFVPVTHFGPSDRDLASDEEWDSEIEEEIITISLDQALDTSILASPPSFPAHSSAPVSEPSTQFSRPVNGQAESSSRHNADNNSNGSSSRRIEGSPQGDAELARSHTWSLIGLNTPTPFLKVNNTLFKGKLMERIGNEMIFGSPSTSSSSLSTPPALGSSTNPMLPSLQTIQFTPQTYNPTVPTDGPSASSSYSSFSQKKKYGLSGGRPRGRPAELGRTRSDLSGPPGGANGNDQDGEEDMDEDEENGALTDDENAAAEEEEEEDASDDARPNVYSEDEIPIERTRPDGGDDRNLSGWQVVDPKRSSAASTSTPSNRRKSRSRLRTSTTNYDHHPHPSILDQSTDPIELNPLEGNVLLEDQQIEIGDGEAVQGFTSLIDTLSHNHDSSSQLPEWSPYVSEHNGRSLDGLMGHLDEPVEARDSGSRGMIDPSLVDPSLRADSLMDQTHSFLNHTDGQQVREQLIDPSLLDQNLEPNHQSNGYPDGQQEAYMMDVDQEQTGEGDANVDERLQQMHWDSD
ncbi:Transcription factor TFIIIC, tau55-related [Phaffia rhodozyma]|uniref:Transcription factor TFIIIC, tau55-related n=1 Tax=Phaffia rhodozyma TaxID=264483 RepID=A0A0F7STD2_PHARH|nr:Transcription factor TFIIIC, tau55-related [Phaffia rhodozyma]